MKLDTSIEAFLDDFGKMTIDVSHRFYNGKCDFFYITSGEEYCKDCIIRGVVNYDSYTKYECIIPTDFDFSKAYTIVDNHGYRTHLQIRYIVRTSIFEELFVYDEDDLGPSYTKTKTDFSLWAPTATQVLLEVNHEEKTKVYTMNRTEKGVYRATVNQDLKNATYVYYVDVNGTCNVSTDPYAPSSTANGERSAIIDLSVLHTNRINHCKPLKSATDAILYECSIRDFTSSSTCGGKVHGKYLGFIEKGTKNKHHSTGFDYIRALGITHVQLMPVFDFATIDESYPNRQYNWGYDPLQYQCLEGSYSSNPNDPYARVIEFKNVVDSFHEVGIRVNMDVVLNHHYDVTLSSFHKIVPYYYFRYNEMGHLSNGSYCGNDFDSCRKMTRKYILDNIKMWISMYGIDGFRFDLMGILDVDTMNMIVNEAKEIKPDCMVYGEGWNLPTYLDEDKKACISNNYKMPEVAHFNDYFRDSIKGKSSEGESYVRGYCTGDGDYVYSVASALTGNTKLTNSHKIFQNPTQSINYVECHDNQTVWDKIKDCCKEDIREIRIQRQKMMIACVLFAQGVPFIQSGQEFCRTKLGYHNTYSSSDAINQIDWDRMIRYEEIVQYMRTCIAVRKNFEAFRLSGSKEIEEKISFDYLDGSLLAYNINHDDSKLKCTGIKIVINPFAVPRSFHFDEELTIIMDENGFIQEQKSSQDIQINPYSLLVCAKM